LQIQLPTLRGGALHKRTQRTLAAGCACSACFKVCLLLHQCCCEAQGIHSAQASGYLPTMP
jgi:hypothetical protein